MLIRAFQALELQLMYMFSVPGGGTALTIEEKAGVETAAGTVEVSSSPKPMFCRADENAGKPVSIPIHNEAEWCAVKKEGEGRW